MGVDGVSSMGPGWYKDPAEPATQRYWTGEEWIGDPLPAGATPPPGPPLAHRGAALAPPAVPAGPVPGAPPAPAPPVPGGWPGYPPAGYPVPPGYRYGIPPYLLAPHPHGLPLAPVGLRLLARLIDVAAVLALNVVANGPLVYLYLRDVWPYATAFSRAYQSGQLGTVTLPAIPGRAGALVTIIPLVLAALWFAYEVPSTARGGQTFGKRVVGISVMALESTKPIGLRRSWRRWNPMGLPVLLWQCLGVGFLLQLTDAVSPALGGPLQLALHDRFAGTVVVHSGRRERGAARSETRASSGDER